LSISRTSAEPEFLQPSLIIQIRSLAYVQNPISVSAHGDILLIYLVDPQGDDTPQGWGLTFMITMKEGQIGRGKNTGHWAGLPNLFWWADREKGVGGIVAS
jgi:hypothetical protein